MQKKEKISNDQRTAFACETTPISKIDFGKLLGVTGLYLYPVLLKIDVHVCMHEKLICNLSVHSVQTEIGSFYREFVH